MPPPPLPRLLVHQPTLSYLTERVYKVIWKKSIPTQIRQLILYMGNNKGYVDEFVRELNLATRLFKHFL